MKKILLILCLSMGLATYAQTIPADSVKYYHSYAEELYKQKQYTPSIDLFKRLAISGDAGAAYKLYDIFTYGLGVTADQKKADEWLVIARENEQRAQQSAEPSGTPQAADLQKLMSVMSESGEMIELGGMKKNLSVVVGVVGGVMGGVLIGVGASLGSTPLYIAGGVVSFGLGLASFILNIQGNNYIRKGGTIMRNVRVDGNGLSVNF